jgi:hypothetical protein
MGGAPCLGSRETATRGSLRLHADHEGPPFTKESPATIAPGMMALVAHGLLA